MLAYALAEGLKKFSDLKSLKEKDIHDIAESFSKRTVNDGRYLFGIRSTQLLIGLIHWVQDFARIGENPSIYQFIGEPDSFRAALEVASDQAEVRKVEMEQSDTVSKAANPGKFKDERKWPEWEPSFVNYLSTIQGVNGVPLSYVIGEKAVTEADTVYQSFNEQAIACAPLEQGPVFQADARKVHQLLKSFLQSELAEQWIKLLSRKLVGREDMIVLRNHYSAEGNTSRRIAIAERTRDTLHYKSERALPFSSFLDKIQKMFNIFDEENESISEAAKVRLLLQKIEHPQLQDAIGALRVRSAIDGITLSNAPTIWLHWYQNFQISNPTARFPVPSPIGPNTRAQATVKRKAATTKVALVIATNARVFICLTILYGPAIMTSGIKCPTRTNS